jgi:hypothetical protein
MLPYVIRHNIASAEERGERESSLATPTGTMRYSMKKAPEHLRGLSREESEGDKQRLGSRDKI